MRQAGRVVLGDECEVAPIGDRAPPDASGCLGESTVKRSVTGTVATAGDVTKSTRCQGNYGAPAAHNHGERFSPHWLDR